MSAMRSSNILACSSVISMSNFSGKVSSCFPGVTKVEPGVDAEERLAVDVER